jgi:hypothetical protein
MASRGHWLLLGLEEFMDLASCLYTFTAFLAACLLVPGTVVLCTGTQKTTEKQLDRNDVVTNGRRYCFAIRRSRVQ